MRKRFLVGTATLLAVTASVAIPVAAQAAAPELGRCVKVAKGSAGRYKDPGCEKGEVTTKGLYEWMPGAIKNHFTSQEGASTFETVGSSFKDTIKCAADTDTGEYTGAKTDLEIIVFTGCKATSLIGLKGLTCENGAPGEITTQVLTSTLGFIKQPATTSVGVSLEGPGGLFAEFRCGPLFVVISGSVIAPITPISKMTLKFKEKFKAAHGIQAPEHFEGAPKDTLLCKVYESTGPGGPLLTSEQCGFTSADTVTNEEPLEVNEVL
jgi:hypothetical protein